LWNSSSKPKNSGNAEETSSIVHHALLLNQPSFPVGFGFVGVTLVAPVARKRTALAVTFPSYRITFMHIR
jgi:hypothetical protein